MSKKLLLLFLLSTSLLSCVERANTDRISNTAPRNYLTDIPAFTTDSMVNVVIEIPAGSNQKWELNKITGQIEWEKINPDSFRVINYLPYPANYGFVPQTLLPKASGGDGDPVDVFVLGPSIAREEIVKVRIIGIIHMLDKNETDSKLLAINTNEPGFDVHSLQMLQQKYPGVVDILQLWLSHYKGPGKVKISDIKDEKDAIVYLKTAHIDYIKHSTK